MKRLAVIMIFLAVLAVPSYSADDDSTPYMPYTEQPKTQPSKSTPAKKKTVNKKPAPKKKTPAKKPAPKVTAVKAPAKPSSLQQAIELINKGRYNEAKPYLLSAINADKNDANVWYWYGVWHEKQGCFHEAQYFYTKAVKLNPAIEPLSRVAYYPEDNDKIPLWDPKRPARVYPVETGSGSNSFTTVPPFARDSTNFPQAPNDPVIPKVPVYTPPEPGSTPLQGDSWSPSVYVPPSPSDPHVPEGSLAVYVPPQGPVEAERRETIEFDIAQRPSESVTSNGERDRIIRADLPLYTPPAPGQKVAPAPEPKAEPTKKSSSSQTQTKQQAVPRKVVRQTKSTGSKTSQPKTSTSTPTTTRTQTQTRSTTPSRTTRTTSPDVRQSQPQTQTQRQQNTPQVQTEVREPEVQRQESPARQERQAPRQEYLPPVGQYSPDPGTISEAPIPPVGQGNEI